MKNIITYIELVLIPVLMEAYQFDIVEYLHESFGYHPHRNYAGEIAIGSYELSSQTKIWRVNIFSKGKIEILELDEDGQAHDIAALDNALVLIKLSDKVLEINSEILAVP